MRGEVLTEREWRKQAYRTQKREPRCWGAQCMAQQPRHPSHFEKTYRRYAACSMVAIALGIIGYFLFHSASPTAEYPIMPALSEAVEALPPGPDARANSAVTYAYPQVPYQEVTFTQDELMRGKMLLINQQHPLPKEAPGANTVSIATYGKGIVPVRDLELKAGQQTIDALYTFFQFARQKGIEGLGICRGTLSEAQQRELQLERVRALATSMPLEDAVSQARLDVDDPRTSDFQQEYTVDIRLFTPWEGSADQRPLALTDQGRFLLQYAWRYGFIRRFPGASDNPYRAYQFRYVGIAHSTLMTYLDLPLEAYLDLLHEKKAIFIHDNGTPKYLALCLPLRDGYVTFPIPEGANYEASYDNQGYAVIACTF